MKWNQIVQALPVGQWLVIEAIDAHTEGKLRVLESVAIVDLHPTGSAACRSCSQLQRQFPEREFYWVHTLMKELHIELVGWVGASPRHAA